MGLKAVGVWTISLRSSSKKQNQKITAGGCLDCGRIRTEYQRQRLSIRTPCRLLTAGGIVLLNNVGRIVILGRGIVVILPDKISHVKNPNPTPPRIWLLPNSLQRAR